MTSTGSRRWLGHFLRLAVSLSLIVWMLRRADLGRVGDVLIAANPVLVAVAFGSYFAGYFVSVARWRALLAVHDVRPSFSYLYWSFMIGVFFNQLLPSTIGGDVARYRYTAAAGHGAAASAVLLDRVFGTAALMAFTMVGLVLTREHAALPDGLVFAVAGLFVAALAALALAFVLPAPTLALVQRGLLSLPRVLRKIGEKLYAALAAFRGRHDVAVTAFMWSCVLQCIVIGHYYLVGVALGLEVPLTAYAFIVPVATVAMALPISINGIGVREGMLGYLLGLYGVGTSESLVFAWVLFSLLLAHGLIGGVVFAILRVWRRE